MNKRNTSPQPPTAMSTRDRADLLRSHASGLETDAQLPADERVQALTSRLRDLEEELRRCANERFTAITELVERQALRTSGDLQRLLGVSSGGTVWPLWKEAKEAAGQRTNAAPKLDDTRQSPTQPDRPNTPTGGERR